MHYVVQEIRHYRSLLTSLMKWNLAQPPSSSRIEQFDRITLWREILNEAERRIATSEHRQISAVQGQRQSQG